MNQALHGSEQTMDWYHTMEYPGHCTTLVIPGFPMTVLPVSPATPQAISGSEPGMDCHDLQMVPGILLPQAIQFSTGTLSILKLMVRTGYG